MKKTIFLFFILKTLLFSSNEFITSNGVLNFKFNTKDNKIIRFNGNMETYKSDIDSIEIAVYFQDEIYKLSNYITSKNFISGTNFLETVATLPFGVVKTIYIPSMLDKSSFYIINDYNIKKNESLEFLYLFNMSNKNGDIKYEKPKDYYRYNENIYLKNLKNTMTGYIMPINSLGEIKLKKIGDSIIKHMDHRLVMYSSGRSSNIENSDIVQIKYKEEPNILSFESSKDILERETKYWKDWLQPIPFNLDNETREIVERFLIYLKISTNETNTYTNIGLREVYKSKDALYTAIIFAKYGYLVEAKKMIERIFEIEEQILYIDRSKLTLEGVQEIYMYLTYVNELEVFKDYDEQISNQVDKIAKKIEEDLSKKNILEKGYEFKIYYYAYNVLKLYRNQSDKYIELENKIKKYVSLNFISKDGIKKYFSDEKATYFKWEYLVIYNEDEVKNIIDELYKNTIFNRYPYFSSKKNVNIEKNIDILEGIYLNKLYKFGDINLLQLNEDINKNNMKIPNRIFLKRGGKYKTNGIDIYLTAKYLNMIYNRGEK